MFSSVDQVEKNSKNLKIFYGLRFCLVNSIDTYLRLKLGVVLGEHIRFKMCIAWFCYTKTYSDLYLLSETFKIRVWKKVYNNK